MRKRVYLGLGSNLGDRAENLREGLRRLESNGVSILRVSRVYETEPQGHRAQPWFLNIVAEAETELFPNLLLAHCQRIEQEAGRRRCVPMGPRTLDIDILLFGASVIRTPELEVPHPRMHQRRFVLEPLAELDPAMRHPLLKRSVAELLEHVREQRLLVSGGLEWR